ncbi:MAG: hypothetical protein RL093_309 [Pseudomonadota bacterium]|jgi:hypothetical protein
MSDRLADAFDFRGRISFVGRERLTRKLGVLLVVSVAGPLLLLAFGVPRAVAVVPFVLIPPLLVALFAADVRRIHDVNQHAHIVYARSVFGLALVLGPLVAAAFTPDIPDWARIALVGLSVAVGIVTSIQGFARAPIEWRRGDPGANRFGPPPE